MKNSGSTDIDKIELNAEGHLEMLRKVAKFKIEERDMALDRYRRTDEDINSQEELFTLGKTAISFLHAASNASNTLNEIVKEMGRIVHNTDQPTVINNNYSEEKKRAVSEEVQKIIKERRQKNKNDKKKEGE